MRQKITQFVKKLRAIVNILLANPKARIALFVAGFALIGALALLVAKAATPNSSIDPPNASIEAESGDISGCATKTGQDTTASGDAYVMFGSSESSAPGYEVEKIPNTNQPPPEGVAAETKIYVSQCLGQNSNDGASQNTSYKTIGAAINKVKTTSSASYAIFIANGIYRESLVEITKKVIIQPLPGNNVWLSGGDTINSNAWSKPDANSNIRKTSLTLSNSDLCQQCVPAPEPNGDVTLSDNPAMIFYDGSPLKQVSDLASVTDNTFAVVRTGANLGTADDPKYVYEFYAGSDPANKTVEITKRIFALKFKGLGSTGSLVRGIGIRNYGSNYNFGGSTGETKWAKSSQIMFIDSKDSALEDSYIGYSATDGLGLFGDKVNANNLKVNNNTFENNGHRGVASNEVVGITITNNRVTGNNLESFRYLSGDYATAAGLKLTRSKNIDFDSNIVDSNKSNGFWCDLSCENVNITRNLVKNNVRHGIYYEISNDANIISNLSINNGDAGINVGGAANVNIYNNTSVKNATHALRIYQVNTEALANTTRCPDTTFCRSKNTNVVNNILTNLGEQNTTSPLLVVDADINNPSQMITGLNNNQYFYDTTGACISGLRLLLSWKGPAPTTQTACTLATVQTITGKEGDGIQAKPVFKGVEDYHLADGNPGKGTGQPLPQQLKDLFNWLPSGNPDIGIVN